MPPRRSHKKSRAGCKRCKARKIKCDEVHPRCGNCVKHGVPCDFEHPEVVESLTAQAAASGGVGAYGPAPGTPVSTDTPGSTGSPAFNSSAALPRAPPTPSVSSSPLSPHKRNMELRLMHHWATNTCKTLAVTAPITEEIWRNSVPTLAFSGAQYLTDALLAIAALHLRSSLPHDPDIMHASHSYMASSLAQYCAELNKGINERNAESLFMTSALIAFQSSASRLFVRDHGPSESHPDAQSHSSAVSGNYVVPISLFHSFQGVKAIVANSWRWLRNSAVVIPIINSQPVLQLDFNTEKTFFGHLLDGLDDEIAATVPMTTQGPRHSREPGIGEGGDAAATRQAYQHSVAVLNWAHKIPHRGAPLAFPATVSRRFVQLLEERRPRALVILASFFALLKSLDGVWWLHGVARREVLGIASLFNGDEIWRPRLDWPVRIALYENSAIPPDVWGADWALEESTLLQQSRAAAAAGGGSPTVSFASHIEMLSQMVSAMQCLPLPPSPA